MQWKERPSPLLRAIERSPSYSRKALLFQHSLHASCGTFGSTALAGQPVASKRRASCPDPVSMVLRTDAKLQAHAGALNGQVNCYVVAAACVSSNIGLCVRLLSKANIRTSLPHLSGPYQCDLKHSAFCFICCMYT